MKKLDHIQNKYSELGIPPTVVKTLINEVLRAILGDLKVPQGWRLIRWSKIGKLAYKNLEEVRRWSGIEQPSHDTSVDRSVDDIYDN